MTTMFPVQRGIPLPKINRTPRTVRRKWPIDTMAVGEMTFIPDRSCKSVSAYVSRVTKGLAAEFATRPVVMRAKGGIWQPCEPTDPGATQGVGVWRVK